jgi:hypothetical protein
MCGLNSMKKRRDRAAVMNGSANTRCLNVGFGCAIVRICCFAFMIVFVLRISCDHMVSLPNIASTFDLLW